jgi:hypothetical protein
MEQTLMIEFDSTAFWPLPGEEDATNHGIIGKGLAHWLAERLREAGVPAQKVIPEDFGWCVQVRSDSHNLYVVCANSPTGENRWRVFAYSESRLVGKQKEADALTSLFGAVKECLESDPAIQNIQQHK